MKTMKRFSTLFAILLMLSISIHVGHVQNAVANEADWMPDANLRTAVRTSLGLADDETLTQAKMLDYNGPQYSGQELSKKFGLTHPYKWRIENVNQTDSSYSEIQVYYCR